MQSPPFPRYLVPPRSKYSPQHHFLKHPQLLFLPQCQRPSFTPIQNNRQNYSSIYLDQEIKKNQNVHEGRRGSIKHTKRDMKSIQNFLSENLRGETPQCIGRKYRVGMKTCTWFNLVHDLIQSLTSVSPVKILLFQQKVQNIISTFSIKFLQTSIQLLSKVTQSSVLHTVFI